MSSLYAVPQAIVFRSWASDPSAKTTTRRLLLRNSDASVPLSFRLTLPAHGAIRVSGACVKMATFDSITSVELPPGGTEALVVELLHDEAQADGRADIVDELLLRTHGETVHVPLVAVRDGRVPQGGEPSEQRSAPSPDEHWDEDDSDDDERPICSSHGRPASHCGRGFGGVGAQQHRGRASVEERLAAGERVQLTPAGCTEQDELQFYQSLLVEDVKARAQREAAASVAPTAPPVAPAAPAMPPTAPPAPRMRLVQLDPVAMHEAEAEAEAAEAAGDGGDGGEVVDEELAFYRSFVAGKKQAERAERVELGGGAAAGGAPNARVRGPPRVPPSAAQRDARKALAEGTFFVIDGMVSDSRGRELGPVAEVLGTEYADEAEYADDGEIRFGGAADFADDESYAGASEDGGFSDHASGRGRRRDGGTLRGTGGIGALHDAGLGQLRDALGEGKDGPRTELDKAPWLPGGPGLGGKDGNGATLKGGTLKGGGNIVRSTAPKPRQLTAAEMEDNWAKLS